MKAIILFLISISFCLAQDRPTYGSVAKAGTATSAVTKISTGRGEKDVSIVNFNTGTDTLIVCLQAGDTTGYPARRLLLLPGWTNNKLVKFGGDTLYIMSSGTSSYYIEATKR